MKVCLITPRYPPNIKGGGEISLRLLAEQLESRESTTVQVMSFDGEYEEEVNDVQINRIARCPESPLELSNAEVIVKLFKHRKQLQEFDILHGYNVYYTPALGTIGELCSLPTVATLNSYVLLPRPTYGFDSNGLRRVYDSIFMPTTGRLLRWLTCHVDKFICLSEGSKQVYTENGFEDQDIEIIPNMIDPSFTVPTASRDDENTRVLYIGSLIKEKGVRYLVSAAARLSTEFEIRIVGDGKQRVELEEQATDIGVNNRVNFVGNIPYSEIALEYAKADIFVHPGIWPEPFGRTIIEAMQARLPVVATEIGGPADIIDTEEVLCPPKDVAALANAIQYAAEYRDAIGAKNRRKVTEQYAPDRICDRILDLYKEVIITSSSVENRMFPN